MFSNMARRFLTWLMVTAFAGEGWMMSYGIRGGRWVALELVGGR